MDIQVGDILTMKKQHPCGEKRWEVLRIGADFKLRCLGCAREVRENDPAGRPERDIKTRRTCPPGFRLSVDALEKQRHRAGADV